MRVEVHGPDWLRGRSVTVRLTELNPQAAEALIETLRDAVERDDDRVRLLIELWEALTGDD